VLTVGIHQETPLNIDFGINKEKQDCNRIMIRKDRYCVSVEWGEIEEMKVREYG
jgi:hypothetical protein